MGTIIGEGITFDDVLLVPAFSEVIPNQVDLTTHSVSYTHLHNFYDAVCCMYKDVRRKYLHGEIVAMALPLQLAVNGRPEAEIEELKAFLREVGIPVSIREAGVPQDGLEELITYVHRVTIPDDMELLEQIRDGFKSVSYTHLDVYKRQERYPGSC